MQQRPPGAANPDSARHKHTTTAEEQHRRGDEAKQRQRDQMPGLDRPGQTKQQEPPLPGLEHPGTSGVLHENEAVGMQRSGVEDETGEKRRKHDEDKAKVTQRCTQVDEDGPMRCSSQGNGVQEKQQSSDAEEHQEMQSRVDQDEAVHKQPREDEDMGCPGLDQPRKNQKDWPKRNDHKDAEKESPRPGLEHPGRNKPQGPPPPRLEHLWTSGGKTHRTATIGTEQGTGAAAPRTGTSEDKRRQIATDGIVGHGELGKLRRGRGSGDAGKRTRGLGRGEAE